MRVSGQKEENNDKRRQDRGSFSQLAQSTQSKEKEKETRRSIKAVRDEQEEKKRTEEKGAKEKQIVASASPLIALTSDEEDVDEALPTLRRSTRSKRKSPEKTVHDGASSTRKRARREPSSKKTDRVEGADAQTTKGASSSASNDPQDSLVNDENTPNLNTRSRDNPLQRRKFGTASKPVQSARGPLSGEAQLEEAIHTEAPQHKKQPPQQPTFPPSSSHNHIRKSTPGSAGPDAYRSAIAEFISQRQQLLSRKGDADSQALATQKRQRSLSESDYGLSDIELPSTDPKPSIPRNALRNSKSMDAPRSRHESGPTRGLLPPLIDAFRTESGKSNLKQKRIFHRAKELAFEQLKWHRENELQQCELELLRREMEAREALALHELQLKRMRVRADIIQHMVSGGASVADVAERLSLL
ncbi:hypothetical protein PR003_g3759 [Phytophthora rubi]|uniref:Uncharacterized protein n=1 Tax=Phytophthora rubi TaxID=129364 RepID=A0A6A4FWU0_9STRA|nr:hypothetical protein PR001_g3632 [Phytophthora rubi]KAE9353623.1 hypothetical protein PR003_g3759 [Phytophthora rubi]